MQSKERADRLAYSPRTSNSTEALGKLERGTLLPMHPVLSPQAPADIRWLRRRLLAWGRDHYRPFPWRTDRDPYRVVVTEILLRQTRADRIEPVRSAVLNAYPSPAVLANADPSALANRIGTLGFGQQRSKQLVALASVLLERPMPRKPELLQSLPGIGRYSAAAVACFAHGRKCITLDVNVARIVSRVFGISLKRGELRKSALLWSVGERVVQGAWPRQLNWALLDLGAAVCRPAPRCDQCPLKQRCSYGKARFA